MAQPSIDVDRVVREVLAELGHAPAAADDDVGCHAHACVGLEGTRQKPAEHAHASVGMAPDEGGDGELVLACRVVTLAEVEGRLEAVRRLVVPPGAVITPAVRDELLRRNVALGFAAAGETQPASTLRLVVVAAAGQFDPAALIAALTKAGVAVERQTCDGLIAAGDRLAVEVGRPDTLGLLLTGETAAGLCLANRHKGVRAVSGTDREAVSAAVDALGANLLVLDPGAGGIFRLQQIVTEFCRGGIRPCPEVFRERLA